MDKLAPPQANEEKPSKNVSEDHAKNVNASEVERPKMEASYVGWKQIGGWEEKDELTLEDELQDLSDETYLDNFLPDKLYGDWYHAGGVFFLGGTLSFLVGKLGFSLGPVFFITLIMSGLLYTSRCV